MRFAAYLRVYPDQLPVACRETETRVITCYLWTSKDNPHHVATVMVAGKIASVRSSQSPSVAHTPSYPPIQTVVAQVAAQDHGGAIRRDIADTGNHRREADGGSDSEVLCLRVGE